MSETYLQEYEFFFSEQSYFYAAIVVFCYDYCLTFSREVDYFWNAKFSPATLLFFTIRYSALFGTIFVMLESNIPWPARSDKSCRIVVSFGLALDILILIAAAVFSAVRVYAMFDRAKILATIALCLSMMTPIITLFLVTELRISQISYQGQCGLTYKLSDSVYASWMMGSRASSLLADGFVLVLTWIRVHRIHPITLGFRQSLAVSDVLMRDGVLYFGSLFIVNLVGLAIGRNSLPVFTVSLWIITLTAILATRFMLDLRGVMASRIQQYDTEVQQMVFISQSQSHS